MRDDGLIKNRPMTNAMTSAMPLAIRMNALAGMKVHLVGIKGAGMAALAEILVNAGARVSGSDTDEAFFTDSVLEQAGIIPSVGFSPDHLDMDVSLVIYSTAYDSKINPELVSAAERNIRSLSYPEAVGLLTEEKLSLLVTGTHGKTTTSALLAEVLCKGGLDPSAIIGGRVRNWKGNALSGHGTYFVLEADEYQNKLKYYTPFAVILTSIDWDHPDFFPDFESYKQAFTAFVRRIPRHGMLVYCNDSAAVAEIAKEAVCEKRSYGFHEGSDFVIREYEAIEGTTEDKGGEKQRFDIFSEGASLGHFSLRLAGRHNAQNATAVVALSQWLKVPADAIAQGLASFQGTARRFEYIGERKGAFVYDDYAHHPEELRATLAAFRSLYPNRKLTAIFHPHTFSRTKALLSEFSQSFDLADRVLVLPVYGSAREADGGISSVDLVREINRYVPLKAEFVASREAAVKDLEGNIGKEDLVVTFGAGSVWEIGRELVRKNHRDHKK